MTNFTVDEHGNQDFHHEGWRVRIWSKTWGNRIEVTSPEERGCSHEVEVREEGIWVKGEYAGYDSDPFTIPWPVIEAIIAARAIIG